MDDRRDPWDYRLFDVGDERYELREVHYNADGTFKSYSGDGIRPGGVPVGELRGDLELVLDAFEKPVVVVKYWYGTSRNL